MLSGEDSLKVNFHIGSTSSRIHEKKDRGDVILPRSLFDGSKSRTAPAGVRKVREKPLFKKREGVSSLFDYRKDSEGRLDSFKNQRNVVATGEKRRRQATRSDTSEKSQKHTYRPFQGVLNSESIQEKVKFSKTSASPSHPSNRTLRGIVFDRDATIDSVEGVDERLKNALKSHMKMSQLTVVQKLAWPAIASGNDVLIKSPSGTGKTLSFLVPILESLVTRQPKITRDQGVFAVILVPTKELAKQITDFLCVLLRSFVGLVCGGLYGCDRRKAEKARLRKGLNIVVATPGRLHDHLVNTKSLQLNKLKWFVVDEADLLLDMGYERKFKEIGDCIPFDVLEGAQRIFLSATISSKFVQCFSKMFARGAYFVDASHERVVPVEDNLLQHVEATKDEQPMVCDSVAEFQYPANLVQKVFVIPTKLRLVGLLWLLKYILNSTTIPSKRVMVFFSSIASANFHCHLLQQMQCKLFDDRPVKCLLLHGTMEIKERMAVFETFSNCDTSSVLFTTDVASRGLDFPMVEWIVQYHPAREIREYVHRVGRTCRIGNKGSAALFLDPCETSYMDLLNTNNITIEQLDVFAVHKLIHNTAETLEKDATNLHTLVKRHVADKTTCALAVSAFNATIKAYTSYPKAMKHIFNLKNLHQGHLAESLALKHTPKEISNIETIEKGGDYGPQKYKRKSDRLPLTRMVAPIKKPLLQSASAILLDEHQGCIVVGPGTKKSNKRKNLR